MGWRIIIVQHSHRRCVEVVELTLSDRPREGQQPGGGQTDGDGEGNIDHRHGGSPNVRPLSERLTTVTELIGIKIAAMSGVISPAAASATAVAL